MRQCILNTASISDVPLYVETFWVFRKDIFLGEGVFCPRGILYVYAGKTAYR